MGPTKTNTFAINLYTAINFRLSQEANRARRLDDDIRALEKALADKEKENADLKAALRQRDQEAINGNKHARENEDLKRRLVLNVLVYMFSVGLTDLFLILGYVNFNI